MLQTIIRQTSQWHVCTACFEARIHYTLQLRFSYCDLFCPCNLFLHRIASIAEVLHLSLSQRAIIQRVLSAEVVVDGQVVGKIGKGSSLLANCFAQLPRQVIRTVDGSLGLCVLLGIGRDDTIRDAEFVYVSGPALQRSDNGHHALSLVRIGLTALAGSSTCDCGPPRMADRGTSCYGSIASRTHLMSIHGDVQDSQCSAAELRAAGRYVRGIDAGDYAHCTCTFSYCWSIALSVTVHSVRHHEGYVLR